VDADLIAESIKRNDFYGTVLDQKSRMRVIAGEHRWRGAKANGLDMVPALVIDVGDDAPARQGSAVWGGLRRARKG
jgi:ParB-like chromosome segregation protein Spo0J